MGGNEEFGVPRAIAFRLGPSECGPQIFVIRCLALQNLEWAVVFPRMCALAQLHGCPPRRQPPWPSAHTNHPPEAVGERGDTSQPVEATADWRRVRWRRPCGETAAAGERDRAARVPDDGVQGRKPRESPPGPTEVSPVNSDGLRRQRRASNQVSPHTIHGSRVHDMTASMS